MAHPRPQPGIPNPASDQERCDTEAANCPSPDELRYYLLRYEGEGPTIQVRHRRDLDAVAQRFATIPGLSVRPLVPHELYHALSGDEQELLLIEIPFDIDLTLPVLTQITRLTGETPVLVLLEQRPEQPHRLRQELRKIGVVAFLSKDELDSSRLVAAIDHAQDLHRLNADLAEMRGRFALALEGSRDGLWEWDVQSNWVYFSPRCRELLGYDRDHPMHSIDDWLVRVDPSDRNSLRQDLAAHVFEGGRQHHREHRIRLPDGKTRWLLSHAVAQTGTDGQILRVSGSLADVSHYRAREWRLREQSRLDAVTQLPRVEVFFEKLARTLEIARTHPSDEQFAVMLLDLHGLTALHESHGPDYAARALGQLAQRLRTVLTPEQELSRFATSQLVLLLTHTQPEKEAMRVANEFRRVLNEPFAVDDHRVHLAISVGIAVDTGNYERVEEIVADVSAAASYARAQGPGNQQRFQTSMRHTLRSRLRMESELREAVHYRDHQFALHYQPIVDLQDQNIRGFESLIRWRHPDLGSISPVEFIPLAESTGLILPLGRWVLREAATQLQRWAHSHDLSKFSLSVNLSGRQAADPLLFREIERLLEVTQIEPSALKIELTETVFLEDSEPFQKLARALRSRGIKLYIDDFGTGYSSLSYLHRFPIDGIKIDKSFVDNLAHDDTSQALVRTIIALADSLRLDVVAEGIEHSEQAEHLAALGCLHGQGYLFGRPMRVHDATEKLDAHRPPIVISSAKRPPRRGS